MDEGVFVLRLDVQDGGARTVGTLERAADGRRWSFSGGRELSRVVRELGHEHE